MKAASISMAILLTGMLSAQSVAPQPVAVPLQPTGKPVARVNGAVLTDRDLLREMYAIFPYARQHNGAFPKAMEADIRAGALKMIVFEELVYQEAERRHLTIASERLNKAEREFKAQFFTPDQFRLYLSGECNGSAQALRAKIRRSLLIEDLLSAEVTHKALVPPSEARAYYEQNIAQFRLPELFTIQTISIFTPKNANPQQIKETRKRAEEVLRQAKTTKNYEEFGVLAEKASDDDYRVMMGDHRAVETAKLPQQILEALRSIQPEQMTGLIQVQDVYTIVRLNAHSLPRRQSFDEVEGGIRQMLERHKTEDLRSNLNAKLRRNAKIEEM